MKCWIFTLVAVTVLSFAGCSRQEAGIDANRVMFFQPVPVEFETGEWSFFVGADDVVGEPVVSFMRLYASNGVIVEKIAKPDDMNKLRGLSVRSKNEAVSFLRLFTRDSCYAMFDEPCAIEQSPDLVTVISEADGFLVSRNLLMSSLDRQHGYPVYEFREKVMFDGKYVFLSKKLLRHVPYERHPFPVIM